MAYYIAKVKVQDENERGRLTTTNEVYCVEAESCTEAEAKVVKEFENVICHRSEEHTSELQSRLHLVCRLLLEKKKYKTQKKQNTQTTISATY